MTGIRLSVLTLFMGLLFPLGAMNHDGSESNDKKSADETPVRESIFNTKVRSLSFSHFSWGAEVGSSIDLTGHDMSTFDADVNIGYKNDLIRIAGVGVGIHRAFGTGSNFVPVYAVFRSSFTRRPSLFFYTMKVGYSFNTINDSPTFGDACASIGCGVNLAMSQNFKSHLTLSFGYRHFNKRNQAKVDLDTDNVYIAQINFGVNF